MKAIERSSKMKFRILTAAAAIPAIATIAYAQTAPSPSPTPPSATTSPETNTPSPQTTNEAATSVTSAASPEWYQRQQGEWRSSKLIGVKVQDNSGDTVGDINDVILANDGSAAAAIIGVGGVLGVGEREVAVQFKSLQLSRDENGNAIAKLNATKDELKKAPQWTWQSS
jgi:hypothetical protein